MADPKRGVLWVGKADPWSPWCLSGVSLAMLRELQRRDVLAGATHPSEISSRHLHGPGPLYKLEKRLVGRLRGREAEPTSLAEEDQGLVGRVLRRCQPDTPVVYSLLTPRTNPELRIRRFRWMDLSITDAVEARGWGFDKLSAIQIQERLDDQKRMLDECEGVVALSTRAADMIAEEHGYPRELITPIGAGPTVRPAFTPDTREERYEAARLLFVGRDWERKGGRLLAEVFVRIREALPHATLTIVGTHTPPIQGEGIFHTGLLNKDDPAQRSQLERLFAEASMFCMPSLCEPWGLVYVEAAQAGVPIAGFREWALPDIVEHGHTGWLAEPRNSDDLAEAMISLLRDPARLSSMGKAAQERVSTVLDWPHVIDRMLWRVMPEALEGHAPIPLQPGDPGLL